MRYPSLSEVGEVWLKEHSRLPQADLSDLVTELAGEVFSIRAECACRINARVHRAEIDLGIAPSDTGVDIKEALDIIKVRCYANVQV